MSKFHDFDKLLAPLGIIDSLIDKKKKDMPHC